MFITDKLIYLQLPKSGCNSSRKIIEDKCGGIQKQIHLPLTDYNTQKKVAGNVRNPWDWYVSAWAYGCANKGGLHERLTNYQHEISTHSLKSAIYPFYERLYKDIDRWKHLYSDFGDPELFRAWLKKIYSQNSRRWLGEWYVIHPVRKFVGYYTFRYCKLYLKNFMEKNQFKKYNNYTSLFKEHESNFLLDYVIHTENLEEETYAVLSQLGFNVNNETLKLKDKKTKINPSNHLSPSDYYDDETFEMVKSMEKLIIDFYGYEQPSK